MTALPGWPAVSGAATFKDIRRSLAGQVVKSAAGALRSGLLPISTAALVTGTATMNVAVGAFVAVIDRNGAVFVPNDGAVNVLLSSAPGSGSRWSVVYVKQRESEAPFSDGATGPVIDKVESTTSEASARAALPTGALELAVVKVDAGSANTNAVGVTITQTAPYTAMEGGVVLLRSSTEQDNWAPHEGSLAYRIDTEQLIMYMPDATTPGWYQVGGKPTIDAVSGGTFGGVVYSAGAVTPQAVTQGGRVYLEGLISSSTATFVAGTSYQVATLPSAARPASTTRFAATSNATALAEVTVTSAGVVSVVLNTGFTGVLTLSLQGGTWRQKGI